MWKIPYLREGGGGGGGDVSKGSFSICFFRYFWCFKGEKNEKSQNESEIIFRDHKNEKRPTGLNELDLEAGNLVLFSIVFSLFYQNKQI